MRQDQAQILGLQSLAWLAAEDGLFDAFLASSGGDAAQVRAAAEDPAMLASVLDFILQSDDWVISCAEATGVAPEALMTARLVLGGGDRMHWT